LSASSDDLWANGNPDSVWNFKELGANSERLAIAKQVCTVSIADSITTFKLTGDQFLEDKLAAKRRPYQRIINTKATLGLGIRSIRC